MGKAPAAAGTAASRNAQLDPYAWTTSPIADGDMLAPAWLSPTQTFGTVLFVPLVIVLVDLLRDDPTAAPGAPGRVECGPAADAARDPADGEHRQDPRAAAPVPAGR